MVLLTLFFLLLSPAETARENVLFIFILAGQSNATGYGIEWKDLPNHRITAGKNLFWYAQGSPERPLYSWQWVPLGGKKHRALPAIGAELALGEGLSRHLQHPVGIIKVTFDGTALARVGKPDWNVDSGELFTRMLEEVKSALREAEGTAEARLAGFFWMQGESDAVEGKAQPGMAKRYRKNLQALVVTLRKHFGQDTLPVVIARISPPERDRKGRHFRYREMVRRAQRQVAMGDRWTALVETTDLSRQEDDLHFTAESQQVLGGRFADAWLALTGYRRDYN